MNLYRRLSLTLLIAASLAAAAPAHADRRVSTLGDDAGNDCSVFPCRTIAKAISVVAAGETIQIARGSYTENIDLSGSGTLILEGGYGEDFDQATRDPLARKGTILSGGKTNRSLQVRAGAGDVITITIDGVVVTKSVATSDTGNLSRPGGGIAVTASGGGAALLNLRHVRFTKNKANTGGALALAANGAVSLVAAGLADCRFEQNEALVFGGGALSTHTLVGGSVDLEVIRTAFVANSASKTGGGGAVLADVSSDSGSHQHSYDSATFQRNSAGISGGAIEGFVFPGVLDLTLQNSLLLDNRAGQDGGGIDLASLSTNPSSRAAARLDLRNNTIVGNRAKALGGGIRLITRLDGS